MLLYSVLYCLNVSDVSENIHSAGPECQLVCFCLSGITKKALLKSPVHVLSSTCSGVVEGYL